MSKLVKITGRRKMIYGGPNYNFQGTAGKLLDRMNHSVGINLPSAGNLPELTPSAPTAIAMAKKTRTLHRRHVHMESPEVRHFVGALGRSWDRVRFDYPFLAD